MLINFLRNLSEPAPMPVEAVVSEEQPKEPRAEFVLDKAALDMLRDLAFADRKQSGNALNNWIRVSRQFRERNQEHRNPTRRDRDPTRKDQPQPARQLLKRFRIHSMLRDKAEAGFGPEHEISHSLQIGISNLAAKTALGVLLAN